MRRDQRRTTAAGNSTPVLPVTPKRTWHPLSLQQLHHDEFIEVVNGILSGRNEVFQGSLKGASGING